MKFFRNLNIGSKLNLGFGLLVVLTLIVVLLGFIGSWQATAKIDLTEKLHFPTAQASAQAQASLLEMLTNVRSYLVLGHPQYRYNYYLAKADFEASLSQLESLSTNWETEDIARLEALQTTFAEWSELPNQLFRLHDNPAENQPVLPLVRLEFQPRVNNILDQLDELIEFQKQQAPTIENRELLASLFDFQTSLNAMLINLQGYAVSGDLSFKFAYSKYANENTSAWETIQTRRELLPANQQTRLNNIEQQFDELSTLLVQVYETVESERAYEDLYLFRTEAVPRAEEMLQLLDDLTTWQQALLQNDLHEARERLTGARLQTIFGGMLAVMLGMVMAFVFKENIAGPVGRLTNIAERIIGGDLEAQANIESADEIGRLAATLNAMTRRLGRTIESLEKRTLALAVSEEKYRTVFEESMDTIFISTVDGQIVDISPTCETLLGYAREELLQRNVQTIYTDLADRVRFQESIARHGSVQDFEFKLLRKDGREIDVLMTATLRQLEDGTILGYQGILRDITVQKEAEQERLRALELEKAKAAAEAANRAKSLFLAKMSHELRTPLNGILGYTQILRQNPDISPRQRKSLNVIQKSGEHLLLLISDILDLAKVEAGKIQLQPQAFNLSDFLFGVCEMMRGRAEAKNLVFSYQIEATPGTVWGDEKRLRQVLVNLLGNAIKFTGQGNVTLRVERIPAGENLTRFAVDDTGIGIDSQHLESIFNPFGQVGDMAQQSKGTGLGLAISRELVELMGGTLQVESEPDQGSTFWFDIPLPEVATSGQAGSNSHHRIVGLKDQMPKILIVDDDADNRNILAGALVPLGFSVAEAQDGEEGLTRLATSKPDAIIVDLVMPGMGGLVFTKRVRRMPALKDTAIIVSSASSFDEDREQSLTVGADVFVPKPINIDQLLVALQQQLGLEWVYSEEETEIETNELLILPSAQSLAELTTHARMGDVAAVNQRVDDLVQNDPQMKPFATEILSLTDNFKINRLVAYLESLQE